MIYPMIFPFTKIKWLTIEGVDVIIIPLTGVAVIEINVDVKDIFLLL
jgi:hypothetical protein